MAFISDTYGQVTSLLEINEITPKSEFQDSPLAKRFIREAKEQYDVSGDFLIAVVEKKFASLRMVWVTAEPTPAKLHEAIAMVKK